MKHAPTAPGPRPKTWWKDARLDLAQNMYPAETPPIIYTAPEPATQRPVSTNAKDRKGFKRNVLGGIIRERARR